VLKLKRKKTVSPVEPYCRYDLYCHTVQNRLEPEVDRDGQTKLSPFGFFRKGFYF